MYRLKVVVVLLVFSHDVTLYGCPAPDFVAPLSKRPNLQIHRRVFMYHIQSSVHRTSMVNRYVLEIQDNFFF